MNHKKLVAFSLLSLIASVCLLGCAHSPNDNEGQLQSYPAPVIEPAWIRDGEPVEFGGQKWYPVNDVEILLDSEVYQIGEYKGVQVFVDKVDTKPYERIYTKFAKNKFRYYETRDHD
ncbi:MAG: hypothetical protein HQL15_03835 [Candidatus Omnitrophica bacterium]|nr:hypothetical protein [Candidatus Omnitrophota bacterium]